MRFKRFGILFLLLGIALIFSGISYVSHVGVPWRNAIFSETIPQKEKTASDIPLDIKDVGEIVLVDELTSLLRARADILILDVRSNWFYGEGHIPKAENLARGKFDELYPKLRERLTKAARVIVYCSDFSCEDSKRVAGRLRELGHGNISIYPGGWEEWQKRKGAIEK